MECGGLPPLSSKLNVRQQNDVGEARLAHPPPQTGQLGFRSGALQCAIGVKSSLDTHLTTTVKPLCHAANPLLDQIPPVQ
jgi:hypothetical protein